MADRLDRSLDVFAGGSWGERRRHAGRDSSSTLVTDRSDTTATHGRYTLNTPSLLNTPAIES